METTIWQTYPQDEVVVVGIINTSNQNQINNFIEENSLTFPILFDPGSPGGVQGATHTTTIICPTMGHLILEILLLTKRASFNMLTMK